mgnify:CR=1 FL=1|tara:strand:+ start:897 stop:1856 length:960 start_codon:yes stop_codon:yes gene_type:complete
MNEDELEMMYNEAKLCLYEESLVNVKGENPKNCECDDMYKIVDYSCGMLVCSHCGTVESEFIVDQSAEWNFGPEEAIYGKDPARCGAPINPLLEKSSMSTMISRSKGNKHWLMIRLHEQNSMDYVERSRYHVFEFINKIGSKEGLSQNILEEAKRLYKLISEKKLSRGKVRQGLIACCVMHSCKVSQVSRSSKEIADMFNLEISVINSTSKVFYNLIEDETEESFICPNDLIVRFSNVLGLQKDKEKSLIKKVRKLANQMEFVEEFIGKTPAAITSGFIFFVLNNDMNLDVNKKFLTQQHGISVVTLNKIITILEKNKN